MKAMSVTIILAGNETSLAETHAFGSFPTLEVRSRVAKVQLSLSGPPGSELPCPAQVGICCLPALC